jgi:broad specificity phosphatase PhoE
LELYLVRHAEDAAAAERRFGDEGLTQRGEAQAREAARALGRVPFDRAFCSPLRRARETAALLLEGRPVPLEIEPDLAEGSGGALLGMELEDARARYPRDFCCGHTIVARLRATGRTAPDGESREAFLSRARRVAAGWRLALAEPGGALLIVSHGGLLNFALQDLFGIPARDEVPFGFDHAGMARLIPWEEGPEGELCVMIRFGVPPG